MLLDDCHKTMFQSTRPAWGATLFRVLQIKRVVSLLRHQIGHGTAHRAEVEDPARVLLEGHALGAGMRDSPFQGLDGRVEVMPGDLESGFLGLTDLFGDAVVLSFEIRVMLGRGLDAGGVLLVLARVGSDIGQDAQLGDVGVFFGVDALEIGMEGGVAGAGQAGIALVDLDVGIALAEVDSPGKGFRFSSTYLRYVLS